MPVSFSQPSRLKKILVLVLAAFVLVPIPYNVAVAKPFWLPTQANEFWRFTDLFSHRPAIWPSHHVLVEGLDGSWSEIPRSLIYHSSLFGGMTRLDMTLLNFSPYRGEPPESADVKRAVLDHVCREFLAAHAHARERQGLSPTGAPRAARLVRGWLVIEEGLPSRRWSETLQGGQQFDVLYECRPRDEQRGQR